MRRRGEHAPDGLWNYGRGGGLASIITTLTTEDSVMRGYSKQLTIREAEKVTKPDIILAT